LGRGGAWVARRGEHCEARQRGSEWRVSAGLREGRWARRRLRWLRRAGARRLRYASVRWWRLWRRAMSWLGRRDSGRFSDSQTRMAPRWRDGGGSGREARRLAIARDSRRVAGEDCGGTRERSAAALGWGFGGKVRPGGGGSGGVWRGVLFRGVRMQPGRPVVFGRLRKQRVSEIASQRVSKIASQRGQQDSESASQRDSESASQQDSESASQQDSESASQQDSRVGKSASWRVGGCAGVVYFFGLPGNPCRRW